MKHTISLCFLLLFLSGYCQGNKIRVLRNSSELKTAADDTLYATDIRHALFSKKIIITKKDGSKLKIKHDKIWGFMDWNGKTFRNINKKFLRLEGETSGLCLYSRAYYNDDPNDLRDILPYDDRSTPKKNKLPQNERFFFSKTLDSKIYRFGRVVIDHVFKDARCFPDRLEQIQKGLNTYSFIVSAITPKRMLEIFNECQKSQTK